MRRWGKPLKCRRDSGYISPDEHAERDAAWQQVGGMLNRMIDRGDDFCRSASDR